MSIKESALSAITSITQSDFVRAVTSAGASRRVTVANLAKAIIESYTGSSLAGSNQSVKSAVDFVNSRVPSAFRTGASGTVTATHIFICPPGRGYIFVGTSSSNSWALIYFNCPSTGAVSSTAIANGSGFSGTSSPEANQLALNFSSDVRLNYWGGPIGGNTPLTLAT